MTCQYIVTLIEDFTDSELDVVRAEQVRQHIKDCSQCRAEYETTRQLKKLLKQTKVSDPSDDYWLEISALIRARTIESPADRQIGVSLAVKTAPPLGRQAWIRSLMTVAASLTLLLAALLVGTSQPERMAILNRSNTPILATSAVSGLLSADGILVVTHAEQVRLAKGTLLMGNPSFLGRFEGLPELTKGTE
ncbi:MAG: anti-sigma factor family protein [Candidatus Zixiibacteriota bacterium]